MFQDCQTLVHFLFGDDQRRQQPQARPGGQHQQAVVNQLRGQLLIGKRSLDLHADHQAHAAGGTQAGQVHGLDRISQVVALLLDLSQEVGVQNIQHS